MPVHDWTRVEAGVLHDFHTVWISAIRTVLNSGLLPPDYYALAEQLAKGIGPDVLTLRVGDDAGNETASGLSGATAVAVAPPKVRVTVRAETDSYAEKRRTLVIRHVSGHRIIALVEILSPGNKATRRSLRTFLDRAAACLNQGIHLLLVDLFPPTPRDPHGIHCAFWEEYLGESCQPLDDKPLTLAAYSAGDVKTAYVEPVAVGDPLPDMPLFLDPEQYINVPLESTYRAAYEGVPRFYREMLEKVVGSI